MVIRGKQFYAMRHAATIGTTSLVGHNLQEQTVAFKDEYILSTANNLLSGDDLTAMLEMAFQSGDNPSASLSFNKDDEYIKSSCYYDDRNLTLYHQQVLRVDGRQQICLNWKDERVNLFCRQENYKDSNYLNSTPAPPPSSAESTVVICHTIEHEKWTRMRPHFAEFHINQAEVEPFLHGEYIRVRTEAINAAADELIETIASLNLVPTVLVRMKRRKYSARTSNGSVVLTLTVDSDIQISQKATSGFSLLFENPTNRTAPWQSNNKSRGTPVDLAIVKVRGLSMCDKDVLTTVRNTLEQQFNTRQGKISVYQYACFTLLRSQCQVMPRWYKYLCNEFLKGAHFDPSFDHDTNDIQSRSSAPVKATDLKASGMDVVSIYGQLKPTVRVRKSDGPVHPKVFLCMERTTFQWLHFMSIYSFFAIGLVYKRGMSTQVKMLVLTLLCDIMIVYALIQNHRRRRYFVNLNKERGYLTPKRWNEKYGLTILTSAVACAITGYIMYLAIGK